MAAAGAGFPREGAHPGAVSRPRLASPVALLSEMGLAGADFHSVLPVSLCVVTSTAIATGSVSCEPTRARGWAAQDGEAPHRWGVTGGPGLGRTA